MTMHMKRYSMPAFWPLGRKQEKFVVSTHPGPHAKKGSFALRVLIRDVLGYAETAAEASKAVKSGEVSVDGRVVRDDRYPVGLMDIVEFPSAKKRFIVLPSRKGLSVAEVSASQPAKKLCSIKGKKLVKGGSYQLSLHDGRNILAGKQCKYKPGDSLLIELPGQKIAGHFPMKEGANATVFAGKNPGVSGKIKAIHRGKTMTEKSRIVIDTKEGEIETLMDYVIVGDYK